MSIQELSLKFKGFFRDTEYVLAGLIILVSLCSFLLGRWSISGGGIIDTVPAHPNSVPEVQAIDPEESAVSLEVNAVGAGEYVASKSGTKYHLPWCPGAGQIKEENKIWFKSKEGAERAGYTPASNCKGI